MSCRPRFLPVPPGYAGAWGLMVCSLLATPGPGHAQSPRELIRAFAFTASGFELRADVQEGSLQAGGRVSLPTQLRAGVDYMVAGFCDSSCTNLDLSVLDPSGEEVGSDRLPDAQPVLILTPRVGGLHQIEVEMAGCSTEPCRYAVGVLEGGMREEPWPPGEDMHDRLNRFRSELLDAGFTEAGSSEAGSLGQDQEIRFPVSLTEGLEYRLAGVCDNDCGDLDLVLYDPSGEEIASDLLADAIPFLTVTPSATGVYRVAVIMVSCAVEPCGFTLSTFVSGEGIGPGGVPVAGRVVLKETHQGRLETGDEVLEEGEYFDRYTVAAEAGQTVIVDLRSPAFDTYLILDGPEGFREENDDWADDTMHSHIEMVAPADGEYSVLVTTFLAEEVGSYTLEIAVVEGS